MSPRYNEKMRSTLLQESQKERMEQGKAQADDARTETTGIEIYRGVAQSGSASGS